MKDYCKKCDFKKDGTCGKGGKTCGLLEPYLAQDTHGKDTRNGQFFGDRREVPFSQMGDPEYDDCWSVRNLDDEKIQDAFSSMRREMPDTFALYIGRVFLRMSYAELADHFDYNSADSACMAFTRAKEQIKQATNYIEDTKWLQTIEGGLKEEKRLPSQALDWLLANLIKRPLFQIAKMLGREDRQFGQAVRAFQKRLRETGGIFITADADDTVKITFQGQRPREFEIPLHPELTERVLQ